MTSKKKTKKEEKAPEQVEGAEQDQEQHEEAPETKSSAPEEPAKAQPETSDRSKNGYIEATLKSRHCSGGLCKEAGETMRMSRGDYARLKKYGRVE